MPQLWENSTLSQKIITKKFIIHFLLLLFIIFNVLNLKNISLIDWDEGVFAWQGSWLASIGAEGKPLNFQTPPLFPILISILFRLFGYKDFLLPLISIIFSILTICLIFKLTKSIYSAEEGIYVTIIFAASEFFLFFSKSGLSDAAFLFFFLMSILYFLKGLRTAGAKEFLLSGFFTTLALYTKYSAVVIPVMFLVTGFLYDKRLIKRWLIYAVIIPVILYLPYIYIFIKFVQIPAISVRHVSVLNFNHVKFLFYLVTFAPVPFILTLLYIILYFKNFNKWDSYILSFIVMYFFFVGFYYPYFRLLYPIIPFISIIAARFIIQSRRYKIYLLLISIFISILLGSKTLMYNSNVPEKVGGFVNSLAEKEHIKYIYAVAPPNISFYINGSIAVPSNHPWFSIGEKFPLLLKKKKIMSPLNNELQSEDKILLIHATVLDSVKQKNKSLYEQADLLKSIEFIDAPVYYKDIYNVWRNKKQFYEIYLFEKNGLKDNIDKLWSLGFNRQVTVLITRVK